jgi:hypothetical protein
MIDVRNDRKVSDVIHACCDVLQWSFYAEAKRRSRFSGSSYREAM